MALNVDAHQRCDAMPTRLPNRPRAHAIERKRTTDRLAIAALSVGFFGLVLGAIVYFTVGDKFIVSYIMFVASAVVALMLRWDIDPRETD